MFFFEFLQVFTYFNKINLDINTSFLSTKIYQKDFSFFLSTKAAGCVWSPYVVK